jgi:hypothetical protein
MVAAVKALTPLASTGPLSGKRNQRRPARNGTAPPPAPNMEPPGSDDPPPMATAEAWVTWDLSAQATLRPATPVASAFGRRDLWLRPAWAAACPRAADAGNRKGWPRCAALDPWGGRDRLREKSGLAEI